MDSYEYILLSFAQSLRNEESFTYNRGDIIEACEAGAYAIRTLNKAQEASKIIGDLVIDKRCYKGDAHE